MESVLVYSLFDALLQSLPKVAGTQRKITLNVQLFHLKGLLINHHLEVNDSPLVPEK